MLTFARVTGSSTVLLVGMFRRSEGGGGVGPARVTEDMKPERWRDREKDRCRLVDGMEVRPSRAREAFCRCEQTWERPTRDMLGKRGLGGRWMGWAGPEGAWAVGGLLEGWWCGWWLRVWVWKLGSAELVSPIAGEIRERVLVLRLSRMIGGVLRWWECGG